MGKKFKQLTDDSSELIDKLEIETEVVQPEQSTVVHVEILKKGPNMPQTFKVVNRSLQVVTFNVGKGKVGRQLLPKEVTYIEKKDLNSQIENLKNRGILSITEQAQNIK